MLSLNLLFQRWLNTRKEGEKRLPGQAIIEFLLYLSFQR